MRGLAVILGLALALAAPVTAGAAQQCFRSHDYDGFKPVDAHAFIVRAELNRYFRIEVEGSCPALTYPNAALVTVVRGSDLICGPLDWDLRVGQLGPGGFTTGCIVKSQSELSKAEVAALPPAQKP